MKKSKITYNPLRCSLPTNNILCSLSKNKDPHCKLQCESFDRNINSSYLLKLRTIPAASSAFFLICP